MGSDPISDMNFDKWGRIQFLINGVGYNFDKWGRIPINGVGYNFRHEFQKFSIGESWLAWHGRLSITIEAPIMPRPRRLNLPGIPQHVTQRGHNRQASFLDDQDRSTYLMLLDRAARHRGCAIHAYVLMTNHVHLLVTPETPEGVSLLMQDTGREYVRRFNFRHQRSGTLWEGRFKSSLVDSEAYCLVCYQYIELNPVRASMATDPGEYPWSSYAANALGQPDALLAPHPLWMALGNDKSSRCLAYQRLFDAKPPRSVLKIIRYSNRKGLPLGSEHFKARIESQLKIKLGSGKIGRPIRPA
jgi:putative transposase